MELKFLPKRTTTDVSDMSTQCVITSDDSFAVEMNRLLAEASRQPWGPGREIDAKVHELHQHLLDVRSRLDGPDEQPSDREAAHKLDHDLRNKLMIFHYHEQKRRTTPPMPVHRRQTRQRAVIRSC